MCAKPPLRRCRIWCGVMRQVVANHCTCTSAPRQTWTQTQTPASSTETWAALTAGPWGRDASYGRQPCTKGPEWDGEATEGTKQQCRPGHTHRGRTGTVSFIDRDLDPTSFPSPTRSPPVIPPVKTVLYPTNQSSPASLPSFKGINPPLAGGLGKANVGQVGGQLPDSAPAPQPTRHLGEPQSSVPETERGCPSSCTIYKYRDRRKKGLSEGTVHCALQSRVAGPLGAVAMEGVQIGEARGLTGVRTVPRQSLGS